MGFAKKAWNTLTTGWVVERPSADRDFFDGRDRKVYTGHPQKHGKDGMIADRVADGGADRGVGKEKVRGSEESNADACLRWSEQVKKKQELEGRE